MRKLTLMIIVFALMCVTLIIALLLKNIMILSIAMLFCLLGMGIGLFLKECDICQSLKLGVQRFELMDQSFNICHKCRSSASVREMVRKEQEEYKYGVGGQK